MAEINPTPASAALIIDDQRPLAELLAERLEMDGLEATVATTATEGLAASDARPFEVAFVDLRLPDMSGAVAAAELKKRLPELKVILITGFAASVDDTEPGWSHIDAVLPKPWRPAELEAILRTIRRGKR